MPGPEITLDATELTVVATCSCGWRTVAGARSVAYRRAALHLRRTHDATDSANRVTRARIMAEHREAKTAADLALPGPRDTDPNTKSRGNHRNAKATGRRSAAHR